MAIVKDFFTLRSISIIDDIVEGTDATSVGAARSTNYYLIIILVNNN